MTDAELRAVEEVIALLREGVPLHDVAPGLDPSLVELAALLAGDIAEAGWGTAPAVPAGFDAVWESVAALGGVGASGAAAASGGAAGGGGGSAAGAAGGGGGAAGGGVTGGAAGAAGATGAAGAAGATGASGLIGGIAGAIGSIGAVTSAVVATAVVATAVVASVVLSGGDDGAGDQPEPPAGVEATDDDLVAQSDPDLGDSLWGEEDAPPPDTEGSPPGDGAGPPVGDGDPDPSPVPPATGDDTGDEPQDPPVLESPTTPESAPTPPPDEEAPPSTDPGPTPPGTDPPPDPPVDPPDDGGSDPAPEPPPPPPPPPPAPPVAPDLSVTAVSARAVTIDVLARAQGPDVPLDPSSVAILTGPTQGQAQVTSARTISYTPDWFWSGRDTLSYQVCDEAGACDQGTVTITSSRTIRNRVEQVATNAPFVDLDWLPTGLASDAFLHLETGDVLLHQGVWRWRLTTTPGRPELPQRAVILLSGDEELRLTVVDRGALLLPPEAPDLTVETATGDTAVVDIMDAAEGPEVPLVASSVRIVDEPTQGDADETSAGTITYEPHVFWSGSDALTYQVCDAAEQCAQGTITFTSARSIVTRVEQKPVHAFIVLDWAWLPGDQLRAEDFLYLESGSVEQHQQSWRWHLVPPGPPSLPKRAVIVLPDGVEVHLTVVARPVLPPVVADLSADAISGETTVVDVVDAADGPDVPLDPATLRIVDGPDHGVATVGAGTVRYTPDWYWPGADELVYELCDEAEQCARGTVTIDSALRLEDFEFSTAWWAPSWTFQLAEHRIASTARFVHHDARRPVNTGGSTFRWDLLTAGQIVPSFPLRMVIHVDNTDGVRSEIRVTLVSGGTGVASNEAPGRT